MGAQKGPPPWTSVDLGQPAQMHPGAEPPAGGQNAVPAVVGGGAPCQGMDTHVQGGSGQRILPAPRAGLWSHAGYSRPEATQAAGKGWWIPSQASQIQPKLPWEAPWDRPGPYFSQSSPESAHAMLASQFILSNP